MESNCFIHDTVKATTRCRLCLKPLCATCDKSTPEGGFCSGECLTKYNNAQSNIEQLKAKEHAHYGKDRSEKTKAMLINLLIWLVVIFVIIVAWEFVPVHAKKDLFKWLNQIFKAYGIKYHFS